MGSNSENPYLLAIERMMSNFLFSRIFPSGIIPPSAIDLPLSGIMLSICTLRILPSPLQCGQYPLGELNENV